MTFKLIRVYMSVQNILTITSYSGYDPEVNRYDNGGDLRIGMDHSTYPKARTITFGVNVEL